jgi:hypothetical protein
MHSWPRLHRENRWLNSRMAAVLIRQCSTLSGSSASGMSPDFRPPPSRPDSADPFQGFLFTQSIDGFGHDIEPIAWNTLTTDI